MDPFLAYDAGFYMPPSFGGNQFSDEPLSNYMNTPATSNSSAASGLQMDASGATGKDSTHANAKGDGTMSGNYGGFPWGMASMDIDQDWSWFMNDVQTNPASNNTPFFGGSNAGPVNQIHQRLV